MADDRHAGVLLAPTHPMAPRPAGYLAAIGQGRRSPESVAVPFDPVAPGSVTAVLAADARAWRGASALLVLTAVVQDWVHAQPPLATRFDGLVFVPLTVAAAVLPL